MKLFKYRKGSAKFKVIARELASGFGFAPIVFEHDRLSIRFLDEDGRHYSLVLDRGEAQRAMAAMAGEFDLVAIEAVRQALADYVCSEGCSCCENTDAHEEAMAVLAELLDIPMYDDESGYDIRQFATVGSVDI